MTLTEAEKPCKRISSPITGRKVGPSISPYADKDIINEGAHTYVAQELNLYLEKWKRKNPGREIVTYHVGEPSEPPLPSMLKEGVKVHEKGAKGDFGYQPAAGREDFREAWAEHLNRWKVYADPLSSDEVIVSGSGKTILNAIGRALRQKEGFNVAVFSPGYPGHLSMALKATEADNHGGKYGVVGIPVTQENHWRPDPEKTSEILDATKPKILMLCNPQNPTGGVLTKKTAAPFVEYMENNPEVVAVEDGVYHPLVYDKDYTTLASTNIQDQVIFLDSSSKDLFTPAFRKSATAVRNSMKQVREGIKRQLNDDISCGPTTAGVIIKAGLSEQGDREIKSRVKLYKEKKGTVVEAFKNINLDPNNPGGAFYLMVQVPENTTATEFAKFAAEKAGITLLPAKNFGGGHDETGKPRVWDVYTKKPFYPDEIAEKHVRVAYVGKKEDMREGIERLGEAMKIK